LKGAATADKPYIWGARALVFGLWAVVAALVAYAWNTRKKEVPR